MREPKQLYDLRYYARRRGYVFSKTTRHVTVPEYGRSERIERRLQSFGYGIQLNLFQVENNYTPAPPSIIKNSANNNVTCMFTEKRGGGKIGINFCNSVTC